MEAGAGGSHTLCLVFLLRGVTHDCAGHYPGLVFGCTLVSGAYGCLPAFLQLSLCMPQTGDGKASWGAPTRAWRRALLAAASVPQTSQQRFFGFRDLHLRFSRCNL